MPLEPPLSADLESAPPLGEMRNLRPRPTYALAVDPGWRHPDVYSSVDRVWLRAGLELRWKSQRWLSTRGGPPGVKRRYTQVGLFDQELVGSLVLIETRNTTGARMRLDRYRGACSCDDDALADHAGAASAALYFLQGRKWLLRGESVFELSSLMVDRAALGRVDWGEALQVLLERFCSNSGGKSPVFILHAEPLELIWLAQLQTPQPQSARQQQLAQRRRRALQRYFGRELDAVPVGLGWLAAEVFPPKLQMPAQLAWPRLTSGLSATLQGRA